MTLGSDLILVNVLETKTLPKQLNLKSFHLVIWKGKFFVAESLQPVRLPTKKLFEVKQ